MIVIRKHGRIVSRSRNLRGVLRYKSRGTFIVSPCRIHVLGLPDGGALLRLRWQDGAYAVASFADAAVARRWVQARRAWCRLQEPGARYTPPHAWALSLRRED